MNQEFSPCRSEENIVLFTKHDDEQDPFFLCEANGPELASIGRSDSFRLIRILSSTVDDFVGFALARVREVNRVLVKQESTVCHIWIFVDEFSEKVLDEICDSEEMIIDEFSHSHFDFKVIFQPSDQRSNNAMGASRQIYVRPAA